MYRIIDCRIWNDEVFEQLSPTDKLIAVYLLTSPQTNRIGIYKLKIGALAEDIGIDATAARAGVERVVAAFNWRWDDGKRVIYLPTWFKYNRCKAASNMKGYLSDLDLLPDCDLVAEFLENDEFLPAKPRVYAGTQAVAQTAQTTVSRAKPGLSRGIAEGVPPTQEQEQEQEQDNKIPPYPPRGEPAKRKRASVDLDKLIPDSKSIDLEWAAAFREWADYRRERKPALTPASLGKLASDWADRSTAEFRAAVDHSISNGYQGLFEPKVKMATTETTAQKMKRLGLKK